MVRDNSDILQRRELEGAPYLLEGRGDFALVERHHWAVTLIGFVILFIGCGAIVAWIAILARQVSARGDSWILLVAGIGLIGGGLLAGTQSAVRFCTSTRERTRTTWLLGLPIRKREVRYDVRDESLVLELSWDHHRGRTYPAWSLKFRRRSIVDTLLMGHCPHAAITEVMEIFAVVTGLKVEVDSTQAS